MSTSGERRGGYRRAGDALPARRVDDGTWAWQLAEADAPHGMTVVAQEQTAGRGRFSRRWVSGEGDCLLASVLLRPPADAAPLLSIAGALAASDAVRALTGLACAFKWPNDVLLNGRKVCGVLTEVRADTDGNVIAVLGVGPEREPAPCGARGDRGGRGEPGVGDGDRVRGSPTPSRRSSPRSASGTRSASTTRKRWSATGRRGSRRSAGRSRCAAGTARCRGRRKASTARGGCWCASRRATCARFRTGRSRFPDGERGGSPPACGTIAGSR